MSSQSTNNTKSVRLSDIQNKLWHRGRLEWLLYPHQRPVYKALRQSIEDEKLEFVLNCARRFGKTSVLMIISLETALRKPQQMIWFAAPTGKEAQNAVHPILRVFLQSCPDELLPSWDSVKGCYKFKNGSEIHIAGVNGNHERDLRGANSHLSIVDEAGEVDRLDYLVKAIMKPMVTTTGGILIISSTPAMSPDHDYKIYYDKAEVSGNLIEFDVHANTSLDEKKMTALCEDYGGENSTDWRREFLVQWVVDSQLDIIPEWDEQYIADVEPDEFFKFYHKYTVMDLGVLDKTAILYGYYDFKKGKLIVQSEDMINGEDMTTEKVSKLVNVRERLLWGNGPKVYKRVADNNNPLMLQDLNKVYDLFFMPTLKDNLDAMVNEVRLFIQQGRLLVHPSCHQLIGCLNYAIWDRGRGSKKRQFARSAAYGHYDSLASLVYMIRNLDDHLNPIPIEHNLSPDHWVGDGVHEQNDTKTIEAFKNVFNK